MRILFFIFYSTCVFGKTKISNDFENRTLTYSDTSVFYVFKDSVKKSITEGISKYQKMAPKLTTDISNFFLLLSSFENRRVLTVSYCKECIWSSIISKTNVFFKIDEDFLVPVITDYDIYFGETVLKNTNRVIKLPNGYRIEFSISGKVFYSGFQQ